MTLSSRYVRAAAWSLIPVAWLATMGYLLLKQIPRERAAELEAASQPLFESVSAIDSWRDVEEYALLKSGPTVVGASRTHLKRVTQGPEPVYQHEFNLQAWPRLLGMRQNVAVAGVAELDKDFALVSFSAETTVPMMRLSFTGATSGTELLVETNQGGGINRFRVAMPRALTMPESLRPALSRRLAIRPGNRIIVPAIDPLLGRDGGHMSVTVGDQDEIEVEGEKRRVYPVDFKLNDVTSRAWMTPSGRTLRRELPGNLAMDTVTSETALAQSPGLATAPAIKTINPQDFEGVPTSTLEQVAQGTSVLHVLSGK